MYRTDPRNSAEIMGGWTVLSVVLLTMPHRRTWFVLDTSRTHWISWNKMVEATTQEPPKVLVGKLPSKHHLLAIPEQAAVLPCTIFQTRMEPAFQSWTTHKCPTMLSHTRTC
jgi:hypothetical protein